MRTPTLNVNRKTVVALSVAAFSSVAVLGTVLAVRARGAQAAQAPTALTQDLDLAAKPTISPEFALTETAPEAKLEAAPTLKRAAGPKAIRSRKPTVRAQEEQTVAAAEAPQETQTVAEAPGVGETEAAAPTDAPATPRPVPVPVSMPGGDGSQGGGGGGSGDGAGSGIGAVLGGIFGGIIRGGTTDGDHCEIHDRRGRRRGGTMPGGGIYVPRGGMGGGAPFPINPIHTGGRIR